MLQRITKPVAVIVQGVGWRIRPAEQCNHANRRGVDRHLRSQKELKSMRELGESICQPARPRLTFVYPSGNFCGHPLWTPLFDHALQPLGDSNFRGPFE